MSTYVNSRGDEEEHIMAIANYLHEEEHLTESATKEPHRAKEIARLLDEVRESRQKLVKEWSKGRANPNFWCASKHSINSCYHIHELMTNAARDNPERIPELTDSLRRCINERDKIVGYFLSGSGGKVSDGECQRCVADLKVESTAEEYDKTVYEIKEQSGKDMYVWTAFFGLLLVIALMAQHQSQQPAT